MPLSKSPPLSKEGYQTEEEQRVDAPPTYVQLYTPPSSNVDTSSANRERNTRALRWIIAFLILVALLAFYKLFLFCNSK